MESNISQKGFLRLNQVLELVPVAKSTWWAGCKTGRFPRPIKIGLRASAWRTADILDLLEKLGKEGQ